MHPMSQKPSRRHILGAFGLGSTALVLAACGAEGGKKNDSASGAPSVIVSVYPMAFVAERVGGKAVSVTSFAQPGQDPHGLELAPKQIAELTKADVVIQIPGFQAAIDDAIAAHQLKDSVLDVSSAVKLLPNTGSSHDHSHDDHDHEGHDHEHGASDGGGEHEGHDHGGHDHEGHDHDHEGHDHDHDHGASDDGGEHDGHDHEGHDHHDHDHGAIDPHMWQDPIRLADVADALAERLGKANPEAKQSYLDNAKALRADLEKLDADLKKKFDAVSGEKVFITSHTAFAYLADRYGLHQEGIAGVDPETEPSPQRLLELEKTVKEQGVSTIFFETTASPKVAEVLAKNVGVKAEELDNVSTQLSPEKDYLQVMRENADKLVASWS